MKHILLKRFKIALNDKALLFWTLIFPIIMATFFQLAFSNLVSSDTFKVVDIAIVKSEQYNELTSFKNLIDSLSKDNKDQVFNVTFSNEEEAKSLLKDKKISGYLTVTDKINIKVSENSIETTILKSVIDSYYQTTSTVENIVEFDASSIKNGLLEDIGKETNYFKDKSSSNMNYTVIYFYTLFGMSCLYGGLFGIRSVNECEANQSTKGARVNMSPTKKWKILLSSLIVAVLIQYIEVLLLLAYTSLVLGISFGSQLIYIIVLLAAGCLAGVSIGTLIGSALRKKEDTKIMIMTMSTLFLSFLSGMMVIDVKYLIEKYVPILARINPASLITDGLYSLYYYTTYDRYFMNLFLLLVFTFVVFVISYFFIRRKKYDSI